MHKQQADTRAPPSSIPAPGTADGAADGQAGGPRMLLRSEETASRACQGP